MYSEISGKVNGNSGDLSYGLERIDAIPFGGVWQGEAYDCLSGYLRIASNKMLIEQGNIVTFTSAMNLLEKYKANKEKIGQLTAELNALPDDEEYDGQRSALQQQIQKLTQENMELRTTIITLLSSIKANSAELSLVTFSTGKTLDYIQPNLSLDYDVYQILAAYQNRWGDSDGNSDPVLMQLHGSDSLYDYYNQIDQNGNVIKGSGEKYIKSVLANIQQKYSGRDAAVNSALAILKLAADKGVKLDYKHKGTAHNPYVSTDDLVTGIDCNPFTSWVVDKGVESGFQWRPVGGFHSVGEHLDDWSQAQPGDVFVHTSDGNGNHVGIIIANDPEHGIFITAEAKGGDIGIVTTTRSYASLKGQGYEVRDMTSVYDGTQNTDREVFNYWTEGKEKLTVTV